MSMGDMHQALGEHAPVISDIQCGFKRVGFVHKLIADISSNESSECSGRGTELGGLQRDKYDRDWSSQRGGQPGDQQFPNS